METQQDGCTLEDLSLEDLVYLEEMILGTGGTWVEGADPGEILREVGSPNLAAWYDYHLGNIDRVLNAAGVLMREEPLAAIKGQPTRARSRRDLGFRLVDGEAS